MGDFDLLIKRAMRRNARKLKVFLGIPADAKPAPTDISGDRQRSADYLAVNPTGGVYHVEFQTRSHPMMAFRMLEYLVFIVRGEIDNGPSSGLRDSDDAMATTNVRQTVLYLKGRGGQPDGLTFRSGRTQVLTSFAVKYVSDIDFARFRNSSS